MNRIAIVNALQTRVPGVLAIYAGTLVDAPNTWLFFEIYASESAYQAHRQTPHFQKYLSRKGQIFLSNDLLYLFILYEDWFNQTID